MQDKIIEKLFNEDIDGIAISVTESDFLAKRSHSKSDKSRYLGYHL